MERRRLMDQVARQLSVRRAFGDPYEHGGLTVIPVALVVGGGGAGAGARAKDAAESDFGGGFGGLVLPMGVFAVSAGGVRWVPAVDVTRIVLALVAGLRLFARARSNAPRRRDRHARAGRGSPAAVH